MANVHECAVGLRCGPDVHTVASLEHFGLGQGLFGADRMAGVRFALRGKAVLWRSRTRTRARTHTLAECRVRIGGAAWASANILGVELGHDLCYVLRERMGGLTSSVA